MPDRKEGIIALIAFALVRWKTPKTATTKAKMILPIVVMFMFMGLILVRNVKKK